MNKNIDEASKWDKPSNVNTVTSGQYYANINPPILAVMYAPNNRGPIGHHTWLLPSLEYVWSDKYLIQRVRTWALKLIELQCWLLWDSLQLKPFTVTSLIFLLLFCFFFNVFLSSLIAGHKPHFNSEVVWTIFHHASPVPNGEGVM